MPPTLSRMALWLSENVVAQEFSYATLCHISNRRAVVSHKKGGIRMVKITPYATKKKGGNHPFLIETRGGNFFFCSSFLLFFLKGGRRRYL